MRRRPRRCGDGCPGGGLGKGLELSARRGGGRGVLCKDTPYSERQHVGKGVNRSSEQTTPEQFLDNLRSRSAAVLAFVALAVAGDCC